VEILSNNLMQTPIAAPVDLSGLLSSGESVAVYSTEGNVAVFCKGFCICTYSANDLFSRNYCLVQLHTAGDFSLKYLAEIFGLSYNHCSRIVSQFHNDGIDGLMEETDNRKYNRKIINEVIGAFVLNERANNVSYQNISNQILFRFKKKISARSLCNWVSKNSSDSSNLISLPQQMAMDIGQEISDSTTNNVWHNNIYAGSMILYSVLDRTCLFKSFSECIYEDNVKRHSSAGVRRIVLTLFFLHALRFKTIEQSKFLVENDFCLTIGGGFLRGQSLRYAIDDVVNATGFERALELYHKELLYFTERRNRIFYTDGHFSNYYGKNSVPMGYDPRRQIGAMGRTVVYLHNSDGEVMFLFESATNTTLSNDIEALVTKLKILKMKLKRKTIFFDRGGYSKKCFCFLEENKMYFVTFLKNRKKERNIEDNKFTEKVFIIGDERHVYRVYEGERRWFKCGQVRIIIFIGYIGNQIPVITNNPFLKAETIIYYLKKRWREENCFKYMIEHFGIDSLTSYKTEEAPDKILTKTNPARTNQNKLINEKKADLQKLQSEFANKIIENEIYNDQQSDLFIKEQQELKIKIKNLKVDIMNLQSERENIKPKIEINLKDANVIMSQKRRLLINSIKALNYNSEKWLQKIFVKYHAKEDETLALIRSLLEHPGKVRFSDTLVEVVLDPIHIKAMRETVNTVLAGLAQTGSLRVADGRILRIRLTR
jgi:transposase